MQKRKRISVSGHDLTRLAAHAKRSVSTARRWADGAEVESTTDAALSEAARDLGLAKANEAA